MSLGLAPTQSDVFTTTSFCDGRVAPDSVYGLLHRECFQLFPDGLVADLFCDVGRRSVPPMIVAVVMVLQRIEGCSDREAVDRFTYDARWKYAAGGLGFDYRGFAHMVLVDMRARLARSGRPDRIFAVVLEMGRRAGLVGRRRVLDSTALYDAVATMDTVTVIRSAIRGLLAACDSELEAELRGVLLRDDDDASAGKPVCDYEDPKAREALIDALAKDANAILGALDGRELPAVVRQAAARLATVVGQDLDQDDGGTFRVAQRVAKDRLISTVDPDARHGRKTSSRGFDGYKGHVTIDPGSEFITATTVTAGNGGERQEVAKLLAEELAAGEDPVSEDEPRDTGTASEPLSVYGDSAYGSGHVLQALEQAGANVLCKVKAPVARAGRFTKDDFQFDLELGAVVCPAGRTAWLHEVKGGQEARFGRACQSCPLFARCTTGSTGRTISLGAHEPQLARGRERQTDPAWQADYKATRPKIERKIGHLMRRRHGGRRARVRGRVKVNADFTLLAAAVNLARLATLGVTSHNDQLAANA
jgi:hypothetical protein